MKRISENLTGAEIIGCLQRGHMVRRACWKDGYFIRICNEDGFDEEGLAIHDEMHSIGIYTKCTDGLFLHLAYSGQPFKGIEGRGGRAGDGIGMLFATDWEDYGFISDEDFGNWEVEFNEKVEEVEEEVAEVVEVKEEVVEAESEEIPEIFVDVDEIEEMTAAIADNKFEEIADVGDGLLVIRNKEFTTIIKNSATLGDHCWGSYMPEMENAGWVGGAVDDEIEEMLTGNYDVAWMWIAGSPMSPYTGKLREVKVDITSYTGVSIGAMHYYVKVYEEDNLLWNWKTKKWMVSGRDWRFRGLSLYNGNQFTLAEFTTVEECIEWTKKVIPAFFPGHKLDEDWEKDYGDW